MSSQAAPAAQSSFSMAMRILPAPPARGDVRCLWLLPRGRRHRRRARAGARRAATGGAGTLARRRCCDVCGRAAPRLAALDRAMRDFGLKQKDFDAIIDGMAMDAAEDIRAPDWATLDLYCDRVASAVGRLSVRIFGLAPEPARRWPTISGERSNSPTSCATSTRTRASAGSTCRARRLPPLA